MEYVAGFLFSPSMNSVVLIQKNKPEWQAGKLNGVGGKVEAGETPEQAMTREFEEEAGAHVEGWRLIRTERFNNGAVVHFMATTATWSEWTAVRSMTTESVVKVPVGPAGYPLPHDVTRLPTLMYNLPYLIPMAAILLHQPPGLRPQP